MSDSESLEYHSELPGVLGKVDTLISKIESFMLATGVLLMALNTCVNVVARFGFGQGLFFSGEINRILIILITFAGIGYAARHGRHIRMSAFYDMLPFKGRKIVMILISVITAAIMFLLAYFSYQYVLSVFERGRILPALGFEIWWIYIWVPLGFAVTGVQYLLTAYKNATSPEIYLSTGVLDEYTDTKNKA
ncbi:TRAP transporter small permease [Photobacterium sp. WH77]|uniref:TRAP transporter small permease protein n=1 Tax=Photobacterium arenosum TaxID=2774143 RepID=A0ABR9BKB2_9GAMM|nr:MULTISPECIES: TRAP transporter small permease [Photobacterium]MBD8512105.1 TRAP transporter small permease [Photobacterium arenosum]MBV7261709.1 TRAP transporter small permease [Photobacterium sp. WH24]MCG2836087.1 TRAP transporter small permease [Photobacterium sp. WH77]MCG2843776.1 TRAP transporter small permease [Photobacterium sp. WH80]